jgi:hypothetical protein
MQPSYAESLGGPEIDRQLNFGRMFDGKFGWLGTVHDPLDACWIEARGFAVESTMRPVITSRSSPSKGRSRVSRMNSSAAAAIVNGHTQLADLPPAT